MNLIRVAAFSGALAIALGAFGAHSLKSVLGPDQLNAFETGVKYQFYHTLALLACGIIEMYKPGKMIRYAGIMFLAGILCFSGSLYLLSTRALLNIENLSFLGPVTPIGGLLFIIGWLLVASHASGKVPKNNSNP